MICRSHAQVKDSLFKNPVAGFVLTNAGNIAVDRKTKDNQKLFRGTFEGELPSGSVRKELRRFGGSCALNRAPANQAALARGESIGVFPEGTSHTEPHLIPLKDGTSWAALEYIRYLHGTPENEGKKKGKKAVVVPVSIAYCDKAKYRSRVAVQYVRHSILRIKDWSEEHCEVLIHSYGQPISMEQYEAGFMSEAEGARRTVVKQLTRRIDLEFWKQSVNAPDW